MRSSIGRGAAIELFDIGVVRGGLDHPCDDASLVGHPHALGDAGLFQRRVRLASAHARPPHWSLVKPGYPRSRAMTSAVACRAVRLGIVALARRNGGKALLAIELDRRGIVLADLEEHPPRRRHHQVVEHRLEQRLADALAAPFRIDRDGQQFSLVGRDADQRKAGNPAPGVAGDIDRRIGLAEETGKLAHWASRDRNPGAWMRARSLASRVCPGSICSPAGAIHSFIMTEASRSAPPSAAWHRHRGYSSARADGSGGRASPHSAPPARYRRRAR